MALTKTTSKPSSLSDFKAVYNEYAAYVRKTLYYLAGEGPVDDLVQEVFIKIWKGLPKFRGQAHLKTYIYRITINTAYDYFRKNKIIFKELSEEMPMAEVASDAFIKRIILQGILNLSLKQRSVFVLYYKEEMTMGEISETLKISKGTVKSRLHHARLNFVEYLKKYGVSYE